MHSPGGNGVVPTFVSSQWLFMPWSAHHALAYDCRLTNCKSSVLNTLVKYNALECSDVEFFLTTEADSFKDLFTNQPSLLRLLPRIGLDAQYGMDFLCLGGIILSFVAMINRSQRNSVSFFFLWAFYLSLFQVSKISNRHSAFRKKNWILEGSAMRCRCFEFVLVRYSASRSGTVLLWFCWLYVWNIFNFYLQVGQTFLWFQWYVFLFEVQVHHIV